MFLCFAIANANVFVSYCVTVNTNGDLVRLYIEHGTATVADIKNRVLTTYGLARRQDSMLPGDTHGRVTSCEGPHWR